MNSSAMMIVILMAFVPTKANVLVTHDSKRSSDVGIAVADMKEVFYRSLDTHAQSMKSMMETMTTAQAVELVSKSNVSSPALMQIGKMVLGQQGNLRSSPNGYAGLDSARKLLNDMIYEAEMKYDEEINSCTDFYSRKCSALQAGQSDLLASNFIGASCKTLMSHASNTIEHCELELTGTKKALKEHLAECTRQRKTITDRLLIVLGDIEVLITILEMTDCGKEKKLLQLRRCPNGCSHMGHPGTVEFVHAELQAKVANLKTKLSQDLFQDTMADLFSGIESLQEASLGAASLIQAGQVPNRFANKTALPTHPLPFNGKLGACSDPYKGGPPPCDKASGACCTIQNSTCYKLQGRFLRIQAGVVDEKEKLQEALSKLNHDCAETKETLEGKIQDLLDTKSAAEGDLDEATKREAKAAAESIATSRYNTELNAEVMSKMRTCRSNYVKLEGEMCGLRKIRGELYKMKGDGHSGLFEDCSMGKWVEDSCTKKCGGGEQNLTRAIVSAPDGGAKCLPTRQVKSCNNEACPIDCLQEPWSGWSKCSADCGGGVQQRVRKTTRPMRYGGDPCGATKQELQCNIQGCDKDCELSSWTKWSTCSKDCGGGTRKRTRYVTSAATGAGKCASKWAKERLEYAECGMHRCMNTENYTTLACVHKPIDVILLLDGSGSMGAKGWAAQLQLSKKFIEAFDSPLGVEAQIATILFSGPRTWRGWTRCFAKNTPEPEREKACNVKTVSHFTNDLKSLQSKIAGLTWPRGGTLTSLAIKKAQTELVLGRAGHQANVVLITDGQPTSTRWTRAAATSIRKQARLLWVPITQNLSRSTMNNIKKWATRKWQENVFPIRDFDDMKKQQDALVTNIIASICPVGHGMFE